MNSFLLFLIKSTLSLSLLYLTFSLLMRKETFFKLNRMVLLVMVLSSLLIPLLCLPQPIQPFVQSYTEPIFQSNSIPAEPVQTSESPKSVQSSVTSQETNLPVTVSIQTVLFFIYLSGVIISFLMLIYSICSVLLLFRRARQLDQEGYRLMIVDNELAAFSFGHTILISQHDYDTNAESIITHEQSHIRLGHFYDLMLLEMIKVIFWFNPLVYRLTNDLKEIHEFQADDCTINQGIDATKYQLLIIQKCVGHQKFALANSFNHCQIKNRITMMNKQKTSKAGLWKVATFLPLLALLLMAFGNRSELPIEKNTLNDKVRVYQSGLGNDVKPATSEIVPLSLEKNSLQTNKKKISETTIQKKEQTIQVAEKTVKGKVVDVNEKPLEGASIVVSGKTIGTVTDNQGNFVLNLADACPIVISYVGFASVKIEPDFENQMTINLKPENIGIDQITVVGYGTSNKSKELPIKDATNNNEVFTIVEQMPEFPGGTLALHNYFAQQIRYPVSAQVANVQGKVFVSFVINSDGMASNVTIAKSVNPALDNEAIRVAYAMPKWKPGFQRGKAVNVAFTIPIEFIMHNDQPQPSAK